MAEKDSDKLGLKAIRSFVQHHIGYNASYTYNGLLGIIKLDHPVPIYSVADPTAQVGTLTLREVLYSMLKLPGVVKPLPLIAEIHQRTLISNVDIVIPNCEEAEAMVGMINKNIAAYLYHYLTSVTKMDSASVLRLIQESIDPSLLHSIADCQWDEKTHQLTTLDIKIVRRRNLHKRQLGTMTSSLRKLTKTKRNMQTKYSSQMWTTITPSTLFTSVQERPKLVLLVLRPSLSVEARRNQLMLTHHLRTITFWI